MMGVWGQIINMYLLFLKKLRRHFRGKRFFGQDNLIFNYHSSNFKKTEFALRFFYICLFGLSLRTFNDIYTFVNQSHLADPQWFLYLFGWPYTKKIVINLAFVLLPVSSATLAFFPELRIFRITAFISFFTLAGLANSDRMITNSYHLMLYPTFFFQFIPNWKTKQLTRQKKHIVMTLFWCGQFSIALAYFMAGYFKVSEIQSCLWNEGWSGCEVSSRILTNMAAREFVQFRSPGFFGNLLYDYPWIGGVSYIGVIWFHLISPYFAFRFDLQRFFVAMRIIFHFGTLFLFGIMFDPAILAVVGTFACTPFKDQDFKNLKNFLFRLPPLGFFDKNKLPLPPLKFGGGLKKINKIIYGLSLYSIIHLGFMALYPIIERTDYFPLYNWRIFKPYPIKFLPHGQILIYKIDNQEFNPPLDFFKLKKYFKKINTYTLSGKLYQFIDDIQSSDNNEAAQNAELMISEIEIALLADHQVIEYEVIEHFIEPIEFIQQEKSIRRSVARERKTISRRDINGE